MKVLLLTREPAGDNIIDWFMRCFPKDLIAVVTDKENNVCKTARAYNLPLFIFSTEEKLIADLKEQSLYPELGVMFWWTRLLKKPLLKFPTKGFINTHPSLLPYTAGAMAFVWTFIDDAPYGVTIHQVCPGIDDGPILIQREIKKTWEDTENTLYHKAITALQELFFELYPDLRRGRINPVPQDMSLRTFHTFKESAELGKISLEDTYTAREFLNLLRSHSYEKQPGFWFEDEGKKFEVRVSIKELK